VAGVAEAGEGFLAELFGDGVDAEVGSCLEDERHVSHELGTLGPPRCLGGRDGGIQATVEVTCEVGGPTDGDQHPAALAVGQWGRVECQGGPIEPDALFEGETLHGFGGGAYRPRAGGRGLAVGRELGPVPGDAGEVLREVVGEERLRRFGDGAVESRPLGGGEGRLDRVAG
jgi:hypothetical protein